MGEGVVDAWNRGEIGNLLLHPKSAAHGINLQRGGCDMIWYSPIWSNDNYKQALARLHRRGQEKEVASYQIICKETVDELKILRIEDKEENERLLDAHFKS
jgi:SNF2 family DNA or RNA helicase